MIAPSVPCRLYHRADVDQNICDGAAPTEKSIPNFLNDSPWQCLKWNRPSETSHSGFMGCFRLEDILDKSFPRVDPHFLEVINGK